MPTDAYREDDRFVVAFDLPGVDPSTIDATVEKNAQTVRAERTWQPEQGQGALVNERPQGTFARQIMLSDSIGADHIAADNENGVLLLSVPVADQAKPRKIAVGADQGFRHSIEAHAQPRVQTETTH